MWHLRSLMDGRHLLNSSSHGSQEQLTSTICTSIAKWLGGGGQQPPSPEPTMGMWTSEFWGGGGLGRLSAGPLALYCTERTAHQVPKMLHVAVWGNPVTTAL